MLTLDRGRTTAALQAAHKQCAEILWPNLKELVNPNIVDAWIKVTVRIQDGVVNHVSGADSRPGYVHGLPDSGMADPLIARRVLADGLAELYDRLQKVIGKSLYGTITLVVEINGGSARISSERDLMYRFQGK